MDARPVTGPGRGWAWAVAVLTATACTDGDGSVEPPPSRPQVEQIELSAGGPGHAVGDTTAVSARAVSASGAGVGGAIIRFTTGSNSGHVLPESATTGADGSARASWVLDLVPGEQTLTATAGAASQTVRATVVPGPPATFSADTARLVGRPGSPTTRNPVVQVRDRFGNPAPGVSVRFVADRGSSANPAQTLTGADGAAATTWTLGLDAGDYGLTAQVEGLGSLGFVATAHGRLLAVEGDTVVATSVDAAFVLSVFAAPGESWTARVAEEERWLHDVPVLELSRRADPPRVELQVRSPATARITVETADATDQLVVVVAPPEPTVIEVRQRGWPDRHEALLRGWRLDRIPFPAIQVDGQAVAQAFGDSAEIVILPPPLGDGACSGPAVAQGRLSVIGGTIATDQTVVMRAGGPLLSLAPGESKRFDSNDECLRLLAPRSARFAVAGVDRTYIDRARDASEAITYDGHPPYTVFVADSTPATGSVSALRRTSGQIQRPLQDTVFRWPPDIVAYDPAAAPDVAANVYAKSEPWVVGDEFEWHTNNGRRGMWQVMALYPPNVVLAVFKDDLSELWNDARKAAMDSLFTELASDEVQNMYKNVFGPHPPATSPATEQMLVLFHDGSDGEGTGVNNPYSRDNRYSTIHFRRVHFQDDNGWYRTLVSHEFAHAWQFRNVEAFSAVWSTEGIANFFAEEFVRISAGLTLDANVDYGQSVDGWHWRLPTTGSFANGYRESHPFLRWLVERLVLDLGHSYEAAVRRVVRGAARGWHGRHFVRWGDWDRSRQGPGLVEHMREAFPRWDPVEARLDWMLSFALDDRAPSSEHGIALFRDAWRHFGPATEIRLGEGSAVWLPATRGGNAYYVLDNGAESASVRIRVASGEPEMAWKVVRFR